MPYICEALLHAQTSWCSMMQIHWVPLCNSFFVHAQCALYADNELGCTIPWFFTSNLACDKTYNVKMPKNAVEHKLKHPNLPFENEKQPSQITIMSLSLITQLLYCIRWGAGIAGVKFAAAPLRSGSQSPSGLQQGCESSQEALDQGLLCGTWLSTP